MILRLKDNGMSEKEKSKPNLKLIKITLVCYVAALCGMGFFLFMNEEKMDTLQSSVMGVCLLFLVLLIFLSARTILNDAKKN